MQLMTTMVRGIAAALLCFGLACGTVSRASDAGTATGDAASGDGGVVTTNDAGSQIAPKPSNSEVTSSGTRVSGATYSLEVQVGHSFHQAPATGTEHEVRGGAAILDR